NRIVKVVHWPRRAAASPGQHTGDQSGIVLRSQMIFGIIKRLAVLVGHNDRVIDNNIKAFRDTAGICAPRRSGLNDDLFHFVAHTTAHPFGYSISRRHLSLNDLVVAKRSIMSAYLVAHIRSSPSLTTLPSLRW